MNVAELKKLLRYADDEAEVLFLAPSECEGEAGDLEPLCVFDIDEDGDGNVAFVLGIDDGEEDDEDEDEPADDIPGADR